MIGVVANEAEYPAVVEFFELFKTPWEFYRPGAHYDVLICSNSPVPQNNSRLVLIYGTHRQQFEESRNIKTSFAQGNNFISFYGERMPIYGSCVLFDSPGNEVVVHEATKSAAAISILSGAQVVVRLGFSLFKEVHHLLTQGQPVEFASIPTLDLHVVLLRELIVNQGVTLLEIRPVPSEHRFIVCLTHDVDHPCVRNHKWDHTMFGFFYRASVGSIVNFCRGRRSLHQVAVNMKAACSLPLVFAGLKRDFWNQFDKYLQLEKDLASTFFVIPTQGEAGVDSNGQRKATRASRYDLVDIADDLEKLRSANREIAVHGIDAWRDSAKGRQERERVQEITGATETGVRMHWLYFNAQAPLRLEKAGYSYDSTGGYNETIGYRAGTTQVFKHLGVDCLMELPLHIMDTALFYPSYMNLSDEQARSAMRPLIENAARFGGVLTINWHDRSLGPERLWDEPYRQLLNDVKRSSSVWFATASEAVSWFRKRRSARVHDVTHEGNAIRARVSISQSNNSLPALSVRVHTPGCRDRTFVDVSVDTSTEIQIPV
jgi:hypothetical protein